MKKLLLSSAAFLALGATSYAADLPAPMEAVEAMPVAAPYSWTGFYLGASVGGYWADGGGSGDLDCGPRALFGANQTIDGNGESPFDEITIDEAEDEFCLVDDAADPTDDTIVFLSDGDDDDGDDQGFLANLHAGVNWQAGRFVIGAEGEVKFLFGDDDDDGFDFAIFEEDEANLDTVDALGSFGSHDLDWLGLATLRAGALLGDRHQMLAYAKGGAAFSDGGGGGDCDVNPAGSIDECTFDDDGDDDWNVGWTIGAGLEYKLTQNFSLGAEYLYVDLGGGDDDGTLTYTDLDGSENEVDFSGGGDDNLHLFEVRASYHF
jgi:outer membrane immunogenic protein